MDSKSIQYAVELTQSSQSHDIGAANIPDPQALSQFQQHMSQSESTQHNNSVLGTEIRTVGVDNTTMGDRILDGLQGMKSGYDNQINAVQESVNSTETLDMQSMLKLQLDLAKLTMQGELINKTVSKSTQNIDTLLKSQ
jgi:type III secretion protein I